MTPAVTELSHRLVTLEQAATLTSRSTRTIQRWIADGRLHALNIAGTRLVNELALLRVEQATRQAAHRGRPGARPRATART